MKDLYARLLNPMQRHGRRAPASSANDDPLPPGGPAPAAAMDAPRPGTEQPESARMETPPAPDTAERALQDMVARLSNRQREMAFLGEVGQLFQACRTVEEVCRVARDRLRSLTPALSGALYLMAPESDYLETVMAWGCLEPGDACFPPDDCWALRCGRPHQSGGGESVVACRHIERSGTDWHLCLPLMAQGESLGVLYLRAAEGTQAAGEEDWTSDERVHFYINVGETLSLALANIRLRETLQQQAIRDPLTGLFNRRYLLETLRRELHRAARAEQPLSVVMVDIDHFKQFNDAYGHDAGDVVLKTVGGILKDRTRAGDVASRYGGEEFALVFPGMPEHVAVRRVEALRQEIESREVYYLGKKLDQVTVSAGLAVYPRHALDMDALLHSADQALYQSKKAGRNRLCMAMIPRRKTDAPAFSLVHSGPPAAAVFLRAPVPAGGPEAGEPAPAEPADAPPVADAG